MSQPKVTFGIIVLNGEPFTQYCLRSLYPFAHQIIVVEGGHAGARSVTTSDGHSLDDTLAVLRRFKEEEDPLGKVEIVTREGFWPQKDELGNDRTHQSRAYAERATGDYLWQVDIDEFYRAEDMARVMAVLRANPHISMISFRQRTFWARPDYEVDCWALRRRLAVVHRVFKWGPEYRYMTHEPPSVLDGEGRDLRSMAWLRPDARELRGIYMYHYSLLFPWQVEQKTRLYRDEKPDSCAGIVDWAAHAYFKLDHPYRVHNLYESPSWLQRYPGDHPFEVARMMVDAADGGVRGGLRQTADVERMLDSWWYPLGRRALKSLDFVDRLRCWFLRQALRGIHVPRKVARTVSGAASGREASGGSRPGTGMKGPGGAL